MKLKLKEITNKNSVIYTFEDNPYEIKIEAYKKKNFLNILNHFKILNLNQSFNDDDLTVYEYKFKFNIDNDYIELYINNYNYVFIISNKVYKNITLKSIVDKILLIEDISNNEDYLKIILSDSEIFEQIKKFLIKLNIKITIYKKNIKRIINNEVLRDECPETIELVKILTLIYEKNYDIIIISNCLKEITNSNINILFKEINKQIIYIKNF